MNLQEATHGPAARPPKTSPLLATLFSPTASGSSAVGAGAGGLSGGSLQPVPPAHLFAPTATYRKPKPTASPTAASAAAAAAAAAALDGKSEAEGRRKGVLRAPFDAPTPKAQAAAKPDSSSSAAADSASASAAPQQPVLEPKVLVSHVQRAGQAPRRIEIERKKRLYAAQRIEQLLKAEGVDYSLYPIDCDHVTGKPSYLALEIFDDTDYESRTPQEWVALGTIPSAAASTSASASSSSSSASASVPSAPTVAVRGKGLRFERKSEPGRWVDCVMTGYDAKEDKFVVRWSDGGTNGLPLFSKLHRIHLLFEVSVRTSDCTTPTIRFLFDHIHLIVWGGSDFCMWICVAISASFVSPNQTENPFLFARRVSLAHRLRREFECNIRYSLYIDSMPTDEIQPLDTEQVNRVLVLALNTRKLKQNALDTTSLLNEVNIDYARTMNKIIFDVNLRDPNQPVTHRMRSPLCLCPSLSCRLQASFCCSLWLTSPLLLLPLSLLSLSSFATHSLTPESESTHAPANQLFFGSFHPPVFHRHLCRFGRRQRRPASAL
jgi:hypothetical protein